MKNKLYVKRLKEVRIFKIRIDAETIGSIVLFVIMFVGLALFMAVTP